MTRPGTSPPSLRVVATPGTDSRAAGGRNVLVECASAGDLKAWARLYQDHFEGLLRHLSYMTGDVAVAEDLAQEAFAVALVKLKDFDGRSSFATWVRGIAHNLLRKQLRKQYRRSNAYDRLGHIEALKGRPTGDDPEGSIQRDRRADALQAAMDALPPHLREAFVMVDVHGMSAAEAAAELGISPGNLRVRATRARQRIRGELEKMGFTVTGAGS